MNPKNLGRMNTTAVFLFITLIWCLLQLILTLPENVADDWMGWRQADTQSIALGFSQDSWNILYPRIFWGGEGPGFVEAEFQLYSWLTALALFWIGPAEWPGQILSLFCIAVAAIICFQEFRSRFGPWSGLMGGATILAGQNAVFLATSVQPDAMSFAFYTIGVFAFLGYVESGLRKLLLIAMLATLLAGLVKPTSLHLGITQGFLVLLLQRSRLRDPALWIGWAVVVGIISAHLLHGAEVHRVWGNTFGIISGGDRKFPTIEMLLAPTQYFSLVRNSLEWGIGWPGALAAIYLLWQKNVSRTLIALGLGNIVLLLIAMRYTANDWLGSHYHVTTLLMAAWMVAEAFQEQRSTTGVEKSQSNRRALGAAIMGIILAISYAEAIQDRRTRGREWADSISQLAEKLKGVNANRERIVVRSVANRRIGTSERINNFEDPRIFYLADAKGWVIARDDDLVHFVSKPRDLGARFFVDPLPAQVPETSLELWLRNNAEIEYSGEAGRIFRLSAPGTTEPSGPRGLSAPETRVAP